MSGNPASLLLKKSLYISMWMLLLTPVLHSQHVGIGTNSPQKLLSVNGSIMLDQGNMNSGSVDSAALRFGSSSLTGISSNRSPISPNINGLDFWTNGNNRMSITSSGRVGISTSNPLYPLDVIGTARVSYLYTSGLTSMGSIYTTEDLIANGDLSIGEHCSIYGHLGVGGGAHANYKLHVTGNGLFTSNVGIDGTLRVDGKITNGGKAIMKSNSGTTLRSGFTSGVMYGIVPAGGYFDVTFCIIPFTGDNDNIRVMISQFIPGSGASATAGSLIFNVIGTQSNGGGCGSSFSAATVRVFNPTGSNINIGTNAVLYLYSVATD